MLVERTADPSASLGMTKGRATLPWRAVAGQKVFFIALGEAQAMSTRDDKGKGGASISLRCWLRDLRFSQPARDVDGSTAHALGMEHPCSLAELQALSSSAS